MVVVVNDEDDILRRLPKQPNFIGEDNKITSAVFKFSKADKAGDKALSINILKLVKELSDIYNPDHQKLVILKAVVPRSCGCDCVHSPIATDYSHGSIIDYKDKYRKTFVSNCELYA
ncbi:hypothetical protein [Sphingobacterium kyonggiense]